MANCVIVFLIGIASGAFTMMLVMFLCGSRLLDEAADTAPPEPALELPRLATIQVVALDSSTRTDMSVNMAVLRQVAQAVGMTLVPSAAASKGLH